MQQSGSALNISVSPFLNTEAWDNYARARNAGIYHDSRWMKIFEAVFAHDCHYICAQREQDIVGIMPLVRVQHRIFGDYLVSLPFVTSGGVVADNPAVASALLIHAAGLASQLGCSHIETRDLAPASVPWAARTDKISMLRALPESAAILDKEIGTKLRAQIKRPRREGAVAVIGGAELLDEFYAVFAVNMRDLGTPVYSPMLFAQILEQFPERASIAVIRVDGKTAAAAFLLRNGDSMEIPWASSLRKYNRISVNMLMYWEALCYSIAQGCDKFDFGRSSKDSNTYRFKLQWGAQPCQLYWHYWLANDADMPALTPSNPKFKLAIAIWQQLPLAIANRLGPHLVSGLP
jgi:serine/alanine adding enzyme